MSCVCDRVICQHIETTNTKQINLWKFPSARLELLNKQNELCWKESSGIMEWKECCKWKEHDIFARNIRVTITTRHYQFILVIFKHRVKIFLSVRIFFKVWDSTSFLETKSFIIRRFQIKSKWSTLGWYYWCFLVWNTNIEKRDIFGWKWFRHGFTQLPLGVKNVKRH